MIKRLLPLIAALAGISAGHAQTPLRLDSLLEQTRRNYPLIKQRGLMDENLNLAIETTNRGYLPQVSLNAQASYQSDVTTVPIQVPIPGFQIDPLSKDQYRATADVYQILFDGGQLAGQKRIQRAAANMEQSKLDVELQKLRERVRQCFLGVLLADEQLRQLDLSDRDIDAGLRKTEAALANGTAYRSQVAVLKAESIRNRQRRTEVKSARVILLGTLSILSGTILDSTATLTLPEAGPDVENATSGISRPELALFSSQIALTDSQKKLIRSKSLPRVGIFAQGGYGRPGLNMLLNEFDWYSIGGVRLSWNLSAFYTGSKEQNSNRINRMIAETNRDAWMRNAEVTVRQYRTEIGKFRDLLEDDDRIVALREDIVASSKAQLDNGIITSSDYLREVNAAEQARLTRAIHGLQLLQTRLDLMDYLNEKTP